MGPQRNSSQISVVIAEKDQQIKTLEIQREAYIAHISHIRTRLLSTLDTLDAIQTEHARELTSEVQAKEMLHKKLDRYIRLAKTAQMERDDLKDAVLLLVEKVELSNDYSLWPHSRMKMTSRVDPISMGQGSRRADDEYDKQQLAYAAAMMISLRMERDAERKAHHQTRQQAEARISVLEAQLARRETQLEICVSHLAECSRNSDLGATQTYENRGDAPRTPSMREEEVIRNLDLASAKNKVLEVEVRNLAERLEGARLAVQSHPSRMDPLPSLQGYRLSQDDAPAPSDPGPSSNPSRQGSQNVCTHLLGSVDNTNRPVDDADATIHAVSIEWPPPSHHPQIIQDLDRQIQDLASAVEAFKAERDALARVLTTELRDVHPEAITVKTPEERILLIERECIRLKNSEQTLREILEASNKAAWEREKGHMAEIERLQQLVQDLAPYAQAEAGPHLLDSLDGEMSMDLATPLYPTSLLPMSRSRSQSRSPTVHSTESPYIDPPSVPLPPSPTLYPSPFMSTPSLIQSPLEPLLPLVLLTQESNMERVGRELAAARGQLEAGEAALSDLQVVVDGLRQQMYAVEEEGQ